MRKVVISGPPPVQVLDVTGPLEVFSNVPAYQVQIVSSDGTDHLVLTGHTPVRRESEIAFLDEAEAAFAPPQPKTTAKKKEKKPTLVKAPTPKKTAAKKKDAA